jgi:hypothetical protein
VGATFVAWIFLGVMIFSLGYYARGEKSWRDETTYQVRAESVAFGSPLPWLSYNSVEARGAPPPIEMLPGGTEFLPGIHVDLERLCYGISAAFGVTLVLFLGCLLAWPRMWKRQETPAVPGVIAVAISSALVGVVTPTDPIWIGAALGLGLVPALIAAACWRRGGFVPILLCSGLAVLCMVWAGRLWALRSMPHGASDFDIHDDVFAPAAMFAAFALIALTIVTVKRTATR